MAVGEALRWLRAHRPDRLHFEDVCVHACGPAGFADAMASACFAWGVPLDAVRQEPWDGGAGAAAAAAAAEDGLDEGQKKLWQLPGIHNLYRPLGNRS